MYLPDWPFIKADFLRSHLGRVQASAEQSVRAFEDMWGKLKGANPAEDEALIDAHVAQMEEEKREALAQGRKPRRTRKRRQPGEPAPPPKKRTKRETAAADAVKEVQQRVDAEHQGATRAMTAIQRLEASYDNPAPRRAVPSSAPGASLLRANFHARPTPPPPATEVQMIQVVQKSAAAAKPTKPKKKRKIVGNCPLVSRWPEAARPEAPAKVQLQMSWQPDGSLNFGGQPVVQPAAAVAPEEPIEVRVATNAEGILVLYFPRRPDLQQGVPVAPAAASVIKSLMSNPALQGIIKYTVQNIIKSTVQDIINPGVQGIINPAVQNIVNPIQDTINPAVQGIINPAVQNIVNPVQDIVNPGVQGIINPAVQDVINPAVQNIVNPVQDIVNPAVQDINPVQDIVNPVGQVQEVEQASPVYYELSPEEIANAEVIYEIDPAQVQVADDDQTAYIAIPYQEEEVFNAAAEPQEANNQIVPADVTVATNQPQDEFSVAANQPQEEVTVATNQPLEVAADEVLDEFFGREEAPAAAPEQPAAPQVQEEQGQQMPVVNDVSEDQSGQDEAPPNQEEEEELQRILDNLMPDVNLREEIYQAAMEFIRRDEANSESNLEEMRRKQEAFNQMDDASRERQHQLDMDYINAFDGSNGIVDFTDLQ